MSDDPRVRLRDITLADADLLDAWNNDPDRSEFNDFGESPSPLPRDVLANGPLRNDRNGMLVVERIEDQQPIGTVGWHLVHYGPGSQSQAWNFGIELRPEAQGQGFGTEAQRLLAEFLFATYDLTGSRLQPMWRICRTALAGEGRLRPRGDPARRAVPRWRLSRPGHLFATARRPLGADPQPAGAAE